jgi:phosphoribosyl-dephospho-CoA transferase
MAPHDLLALGPDGLAALAHATTTALPAWAIEALERAAWVVVRRAEARDGLIPIGIRGGTRSERFGAYLPAPAVARCVRPEDLASTRAWRKYACREGTGILASLELVAAICDAWGLAWGPTGSAGFTLASGWQALTATSDLDLLIRASHPLAVTDARHLFQALLAAAHPTRLDIQVETGIGAVLLAEYVCGKMPVLLRTSTGPRLVDDLKGLWDIDVAISRSREHNSIDVLKRCSIEARG